MKRIALGLMMAAAPASAQFLSFEVTFKSTGCVPCTESMKERLERVRGVESAELDLEKGRITLKLAEENRVRLGPLRARITQDGTEIEEMLFTAKGEVSGEGEELRFAPGGLNTAFPLTGDVEAGEREIRGKVVASDAGVALEDVTSSRP